MIVAEQKPLQEITGLIGEAKRVLLLGCGACVTICFAGGRKEVGLLAAQMRIAAGAKGLDIEVAEETVERQCEDEFVQPLKEVIEKADVIVSLACGVGVQTLVELYPDKIFLPGLNTTFYGRPKTPGVFAEYCAGCGDCLLGLTGGVCPVARCSKHMLNGPCGGSEAGRCEVDPGNVDCAWQLIYDRLKKLGRLDQLEKIAAAKDWRSGGHGGPRRIVREELLPLEFEKK
mgnify:CR=1 FL=1